MYSYEERIQAVNLYIKLGRVPGIGTITASAGGFAGRRKKFDGGRQVAAWLGLVPKQHSSGGKQNLMSIVSVRPTPS